MSWTSPLTMLTNWTNKSVLVLQNSAVNFPINSSKFQVKTVAKLALKCLESWSRTRKRKKIRNFFLKAAWILGSCQSNFTQKHAQFRLNLHQIAYGLTCNKIHVYSRQKQSEICLIFQRIQSSQLNSRCALNFWQLSIILRAPVDAPSLVKVPRRHLQQRILGNHITSEPVNYACEAGE